MPSKIEWTDETWNPLRARRKDADSGTDQYGAGGIGWHCELHSDGCTNCYAQALNAKRFGTGLPYTRSSRDKVDIVLHEPTLSKPLSWKRPRLIFPCSMTDLFGEWHTDEMIGEVQAVMALAHRHRFIVLTKRAERLPLYYGSDEWAMVEGAAQNRYEKMTGNDPSEWLAVHWPLPNVALLVSGEDQKTVDRRVPHLVNTPAAVRGLSLEPMLELPNLRLYLKPGGLDAVIIGVESNGKRVGRLGSYNNERQWIEAACDVVQQCVDAGVRVFVKQIPIRGLVSHNPAEWPAALCIRQPIFPMVAA